MRRLMRAICCTAAVATMTACGSQGPASSPSNSPSQSSVFPLTITRVGGVAGFHDVLVVTSDGVVSVTQRERRSGSVGSSPRRPNG